MANLTISMDDFDNQLSSDEDEENHVNHQEGHSVYSKIRSILNEIKKIDLTISTDMSLKRKQNDRSSIDELNPRCNLDYWMLKHALNINESKIPVLRFEDELYKNSLFKQFWNTIEPNVKCWPFYINSTNHRICAYYYPELKKIVFWDSSQYFNKKQKEIIKTLLNDLSENSLTLTFMQNYNPQSYQCIKSSQVRFVSNKIIKSGGTCAIWSRLMFIIGKISTHYTINEIELLEYLRHTVFLLPNFIIQFQLWTQNCLPEEMMIKHRKSKRIATSALFIDKTALGESGVYMNPSPLV